MTGDTSPYVLGIDFGTSNTAIAVYFGGKEQVLMIEGEKTMPSVLSVLKNGKIVVGKQAKGRRLIEPDATVSSIKRLIGQDWTKSFVEAPGRMFSAIDIASEILYKAVTLGALDPAVDLKGEPLYAVLCVPANFNDAQRKAVLQAGTMAGLEVLAILEEPVAASYAYAMEKERDQTILVYDLGGGTFDVSILRVDSSQTGRMDFQVLAKEGIQTLGGDDFDYALMKMAEEQFRKSSGIDVFDTNRDQGASFRKIRVAQQKLRDAAVAAKHELSEFKSARISIPNLLHDRNGKAYHLDEIQITRDEFNEAIRDLIESSQIAVEAALWQAGLDASQIDRVLLVGGSTKVPLVREMLRTIVGQEPYSDTDPDTAVARGAAILGATLNTAKQRDVQSAAALSTQAAQPAQSAPQSTQAPKQNKTASSPAPASASKEPAALPTSRPKPNQGLVPAFVIDKQDIVGHHLGIEIAGGRFDCLIPKGTLIPKDKPVSAKREYTTQLDAATQFIIRVFQATAEVQQVTEPNVRCIGEFSLHGIPDKPGGKENISVTFEIDSENLLRVSATSSGSTGRLEISTGSI